MQSLLVSPDGVSSIVSETTPSSLQRRHSSPLLATNSDLNWLHYFRRIDSYDERDLQLLLTKQSRRRLKDPWAFRKTLSYWVAISLIAGSTMFASGSYFWMNTSMADVDKNALVNYPFFIGSWVFTMGAFFAFLVVVNVDEDDFVWYGVDTKSVSWWVVTVFLVGALFYNINTAGGLVPLPPWLVWGSATIGGILFAIGGALELIQNKGYRWRPTKLSWWLSYCNCVGGFCFAFASLYGLLVNPASNMGVKIPFLVGSIGYFVSGIVSVLMWKLDQFGSAFLPYLNLDSQSSTSPQRGHLSSHGS